MELDKSIILGKRPLTCFDPEHVYQFLYIGHSNSLVYLGGWTLSLEDLFAYFETGEGVGDEETWHLFGILEE